MNTEENHSQMESETSFKAWKKILGFQIGDRFEMKFGYHSEWHQVEIVTKEENGYYLLRILKAKGNPTFHIRLEVFIAQHPELFRGLANERVSK